MTISLNAAFNQLKEMEFPQFGESDELADWTAEMAELDAYVAGIATTVLTGGTADTSTLMDDVSNLRIRLDAMTVPDEDQDVYHQCSRYLSAIEEVIQSLTKQDRSAK